MIEKVIENWLDKTNERSLQVPFSLMLAAEGYNVVHISRHCPMELGKDIIAIAADGTPCVFQLKTAINGRIPLSLWRQINSQVIDLVTLQIDHPAVDNTKYHRSFLVTNGVLDEEVQRAIQDLNRGWVTNKQPYFKLETILKGDILPKAIRLGTSLWPTELKDANIFLELLLENGKGNVPKQKLSSLFESVFALMSLSDDNPPSANKCGRLVSSATLLNAIAVSPFTNECNYVSEIEAWTMYFAYVLAFAERWDIEDNIWKAEFEIAILAIWNALSELCDELEKRTDLVEGDPFVDTFVYKIRVTNLIALMSIYALWRIAKGMKADKIDDFIRDFCFAHKNEMFLWGEAAVAQYLAFFWFYRKIDATTAPIFLLFSLISRISRMNQPRSLNTLANPYYDATDIVHYYYGAVDTPLEDSFNARSYCLDGLVHMAVRRNWKQSLITIWSDITKIGICRFEPEYPWQFYRWRNPKGVYKLVLPVHTKKWQDLQNEASECQGSCIPSKIKQHPILLLLFMCFFPHRMNAQVIRWLDTQLSSS